MPITVTQPTEEGQAPTLAISPEPDETKDGLGVWTLDKRVAEAFPTLTEALTAAGFTYVGAEEKAAKEKDGEPTVTLRYSRPDPDALRARSEDDTVEPEDAEPEPEVAEEPAEDTAEDTEAPAPKAKAGKAGKS